MNAKRRILLIAIASWSAVGLRRRSKNPIAASLSLVKSSASIASSFARASYPAARLSLKFARRFAWGAFRALIWPKK